MLIELKLKFLPWKYQSGEIYIAEFIREKIEKSAKLPGKRKKTLITFWFLIRV